MQNQETITEDSKPVTNPGLEFDDEKKLVELQKAYNEAKLRHIKFNKPFSIYYFEREDKKPLASTDVFVRKQVMKQDNDDFQKTGKTAGIILTKTIVTERNQIYDLYNKGEKGTIKFLISLETQLICELFEQSGLTTVVQDKATSVV
jgi:hypothetical protein